MEMTDRRDAADGVAGASTNELSRSPLDRATDDLGQAPFIDAVGAGGKHQNGFVTVNGPEDERLYDLRDVTADRGCRFHRGPGARWHDPHLAFDTEPIELLCYARLAAGQSVHVAVLSSRR